MTKTRPRLVKPRLVLHAGAFKTGTSTLQSLFALHEAEIAERFGVHYPTELRRVNSGSTIAGHPKVDSVAHHMIAHLLRQEGRSGRRNLAAQLDAMGASFRASGRRTILVSTELLSFIPREAKAFLVDRLADYDLHVVYAVRNPVDYLESVNNQTLKSGERLRRRPPGEEPRVPFLASIEDWTQLVGPERVRVIAFSSRDVQGFFRRLFEAFDDPGFAAFALERLPRTNASISAEGARVRLMLNAFLPRARTMDRRRRHAVTRQLAELDARLERRTPLVTLDSAAREATAAANRDEIEAICARFLPPETWPLLATPERGLVAVRTDLDGVVFTARDLDRIAAYLVRARQLFLAETPRADAPAEALADMPAAAPAGAA